LFTSSKGITSFEAEIRVSTNSKPVGAGSDEVISGNGNNAPPGVSPKNAVYKSFLEKLFWYNLTPKSFIASDTKSLDTPKSNLLSALYF